MSISAKDVKHLRDITGAGMMDCKKALQESNGDIEGDQIPAQYDGQYNGRGKNGDPGSQPPLN